MIAFHKTLKQGPGIPLVFLHGFLGNSLDWEAVCSYLPPCHCIGVDLPGHGRSPFSETFDFVFPAPKFHLIGYSMGGRLALMYAMRHPERIERLLIASSHPGLASEEAKSQRLESDKEWAKRLVEWPIDDFLKCWYDQPLFTTFKPNFSMRRQQNPYALASALIHYSLGKQPLLQVDQALHIVGEKDAKFRALHPNAILIPEAGHVVHLENPSAFARIIEQILYRI